MDVDFLMSMVEVIIMVNVHRFSDGGDDCNGGDQLSGRGWPPD